MREFPPLETLGRRICITGPSSAGKSTLAAALGRKLDLPAVYLDQLFHQPNTNWVPRQATEFDRLHAEAIAGESWAIDGNYSRLLPPRLLRATGVIALESSRWSNLFRYLKRTLLQSERAGNLEGGKDRLKWMMIRYIVVEQPPKLPLNAKILSASGLPMVQIRSMRELNALYRAWRL